jgi:hypothetical protein
VFRSLTPTALSVAEENLTLPQIAEVCANQEDFVDICYEIVCPPTADDCSPGVEITSPLSSSLLSLRQIRLLEAK